MEFTDQQIKIIEHTHGHLLVIAGPGSGKTRTIIEKIAYIFSEKIIPEPYGVLAITFTNSAANEMSARLRKTGFIEWDRIFIGTFHSFSRYILSCYGSDLGINENFDIADKELQKVILNSIMVRADDRQINNFLDLIERNKREGIYPDDFSASLERSFNEVYKTYQLELRKRNLLDYSDLIYYAVKLVKGSNLVSRLYKNFFRYIFVDEFQDTDHQQLELVKLFSVDAIGSTIVADDDQSIFGWRGADRTNIDLIMSKLNSEYKELGTNFRSDQIIVEAANAVIRQETSRRDKNIQANSNELGKIYLNCYEDEIQEAKTISETIHYFTNINKITDLGQFAIIARVRYRTNCVIKQLRKNGIKCFDRSKLKFEEGWDTLLMLSVLGQACVPESSDRFYNLLSAIDTGAISFKLGLDDALRFTLEIKNKILRDVLCEPTKASISTILESSDFWSILRICCWSDADYQKRKQNLFNLIVCLVQTCIDGQISLIDAIDQLAGIGAVQILSGQEAKGREFDFVFFIGLEDGLIPDYRSFDNESQLSEERRIFYVAMTRAKRELFLSYVSKRMMRWGEIKAQPSRFIKAIPREMFTQ